MKKNIKLLLNSFFPVYSQRIIYIIKNISTYFDHNPNEISIVFKLLSKVVIKGVMVDVGAHYGGSLRPFALKNWLIFAFEPDNHNRNELIKSFHKYDNVIIDDHAISNEIKFNQPFYTSDVSTGISGLSNFHPSHKETSHVDLITLDQYCQEHKIEYIDFLKIDTEGYDIFVLKSLDWDKINPRVIFCEFEDRKTIPLGYSYHDLAKYLIKKEYKVIVSEWYPVIEYATKHQWRRFKEYPTELLDIHAFGNLIALRDGETYKILKKLISSYNK